MVAAVDFDELARRISPKQLARAVGAERKGAGWRCPLPDRHENADRDPSFSVFEDGSRTAAKCHAPSCGLAGSPVSVYSQVTGLEPPEAAEELAREIGMPTPSENGGRGRSREPEEVYTYRGLDGDVRFQVVRFPGKRFRQRAPDPDGDGWRWSTSGVTKVLYRLPEVVEAAALEKTVYVVEGEKDVENLREEGHVATTPPGGAGKWRGRYAEALEGAQVRIVADRDEAGREHAREVAESVEGLAASVEVLRPVVDEEGADVSDHLDAGHDLDDLKPLPEEPEEAPDPEEDPTLTDTGNSERLARLHGDRLHYIPKWSSWLVEKDGFWSLDHDDVQVRELAKDVGRWLKHEAAEIENSDRAQEVFKFGIRSLNSGRIGSMVNLARGVDGIPLDHQDLDADPWLLGVENGVVDLESGRLRPADPDDLLTRRCPVSFDPDAEAPRWERAMREWFPDEEVRDYVKRAAGSALVGKQVEHQLLFHYGDGRNGKGSFHRALLNVLGDYATVAHLSLLLQYEDEHDTVKAELFRKRLAVASETKHRVKLDEASVKNLTGGDRITARRMREDPWQFDPSHSLWLQTNHLPEIAGRDRGIWSRIRVVRWEETFEGEDADKYLDEKLADEAPGILRWLVEGCLAWQEHGLDEPEPVVRETLDYRKSEDKLARFRADVGLEFSPDLEIPAQELQERLTDWAQEEGIQPPRKQIGTWLREKGCEKKRPSRTVDGEKKRVRVWRGVGIPNNGHETEQTDALA